MGLVASQAGCMRVPARDACSVDLLGVARNGAAGAIKRAA